MDSFLYWPALFLLLAVLAWVVGRILLPAFSWRGRRLLFSHWRRMTRWEFWPLWQFNAPVLAYVLWRGLFRYRNPLLFTASNPAMPHGGVIGERKSTILKGLAGAGEAIARWEFIPAGEVDYRWGRLADFRRRLDLGWPLVLKPDAGQRGLGVRIVRSEEEARGALERFAGPLIVQEYIGGREYGLFYARVPGEAAGRLISITDKRMTAVTGDGRRTLENLILADERAVCLAPLFLERFRERLAEVPAVGEVIELVSIGTHSRGALFLDGARHGTPELEAAVDRIARCYTGFYFGRFDVRVPSVADLEAGRNLKVLELNGVTSESTHIYDPRYGVLAAWGTLFRQWELAFRIGAENARRGAPVPTLGEFFRDLRSVSRRQDKVAAAERKGYKKSPPTNRRA